jgi:hypothetical protein
MNDMTPKEYERWYKAQHKQSNAPAWIGLAVVVCVGLLIGAAVLVDKFPRMDSSSKIDATQPARTLPTLTADQLAALAAAANKTAAEDQALNQAIPTEDTSKPPLEPTELAARQAQQGGLATTVPATSFSPSDTGYRPVATPTTMLTDEQFQASQASEEQNFLNTSASGQTPAQQMVQTGNAEHNAQTP